MAVVARSFKTGRLCIQCLIGKGSSPTQGRRTFQTSAIGRMEGSIETQQATPEPLPPSVRVLDANTVSSPKLERRLIRRTGQQPIGSRRRRAALQTSANIPFESLPYQCFQEARKVLLADRKEKLRQIEEERRRIAKVLATPAKQCGGEYVKKGRLVRMHNHLQDLKILADINDPIIKKRFEDGTGNMNRPIYRHLADRQWRQQRRLVLLQRINQMHLVPDVLSALEPTAEVTMIFARRNVQPGEFVNSSISEKPPKLNIQVFDRGERLVTIAVVDPDVPNVETDSFDSRCHFLATNVPVSPVAGKVDLARLPEEAQLIRPWLPPHAQRGSPYHRLAVLVLEQQEDKIYATEDEKLEAGKHSGFDLRSFMRHIRSKPVGVHLFRTVWDDATAGVMQRAGIEGANIEFKRKKPEKLPYKKKDGERYR